jgi:hypothetical protein
MKTAEFLKKMKHSPIGNYGGIPGLTSWLIGEPGKLGLVRLLECSRDHQEPIIPHSHRFDFHCVVLAGTVRNLTWIPTERGDQFQITKLRYRGAAGKYEREIGGMSRWAILTREYKAGDEYAMAANEVHSIFFARDTSVLFFEGPQVSDTSIILEPVVDGEALPTFKVEPWMFKCGGKNGGAA